MNGFNIKSYDIMYNELCQGNVIIKDKLKKKSSFENDSEIYGVLNKDWVMNLKELVAKKKAKDKLKFHFYLINPKNEQKCFYLFENKIYKYNFPLNFIIVSKKFINLILGQFTIDEQKKISYQRLFTTYIGANCIIRKDNRKNHLDYFITLSYDENLNNKVDYILVFKDEEHARNNINLILSNNINFYMEYIGYSYEEEIKEIKNDQNQNEIVGYFIKINYEDTNNNNINNEDEDENENEINTITENINLEVNNGDNLDNDLNSNNINIMNENFMLNMFNNMNMNNTINNQANLNSINNYNNFN